MKKVMSVVLVALFVAGSSAFASEECTKKKECSKDKKECAKDKTECEKRQTACAKGKQCTKKDQASEAA